MKENQEICICMVGIDYNKASIEARELFSFTQAGAIEGMRKLRQAFTIDGCVILSTCNRTELWISGKKDKMEKTPWEMLCIIKELDIGTYENLAVLREGEAAILHLFELSCGLESKIFGEDQILSQVKEAIHLSHHSQSTDAVLEKVFQSAIGAAKKVKTQMIVSPGGKSTASQVLKILKSRYGKLKGIPCLIIGNGKLSQMVGNTLLFHEMDVIMTTRKRIHGHCNTYFEETDEMNQEDRSAEGLEGCRFVPYEERLLQLQTVKIVISATRSPHYTIKKRDAEEYLEALPCLWIDLAVPRDIDPEIRLIEGLDLLDIDQLGDEESKMQNELEREKAKAILQEDIRELNQWLLFRNRVPEIHHILTLSAEDVTKRLECVISSIDLDEEDKNRIQIDIEHAVKKSIGKLLFGLKGTLRDTLWKECIDAVQEAATKDTLKS